MTVLYFILAAVALGVLVFVHEMGHYIVAKLCRMRVEVFSIGFGRPILKWRWNDVDWQLCILPFGGYVRIAGMEFTKKEKGVYVEPYEIPEGFFSKPPYQRILVALAGPFANFIMAFLLLFVLWVAGGREKPFADFTHLIGWVDPKSEIYALGVRPGDILNSYDGRAYTNSKDLLYAAMLSDKKVELSGMHVDYKTGQKRPFTYKIETYQAPNSLDGILTTGIRSGARYLLYDRLQGGAVNPLPEGSPMEGSGIRYGDQLVWADGQLLFSMDELSYLLNRGEAFLTVRRGNEIFHTRQPRVKAGDLVLSTLVRNEIVDWQYEAGLKVKWQDLYVLPYNLTADATVESPLSFIDEETKKEAFPLHPYSSSLERSLRVGDRVIAIDGVAIQTAYQLLDLLQTHHVLLMVDRSPLQKDISWKNQDAIFAKSFQWDEMKKIAMTIGTDKPIKESGGYVLLNPVEPKSFSAFALSPVAKEKIESDLEAQLHQIEEIKDQEKKARALQYFREIKNRPMLGITLQDALVNYNPNPGAMFGNLVVEAYQTLKALFLGYLNPKWISGPIGIVQVLHHGWTLGIGEALFWISVISLNLGVLNLLPIPVLDGGYICLSLWEMITRRRIKAKTLERIIVPFVILLIALFIFLTFQDLTRLF